MNIPLLILLIPLLFLLAINAKERTKPSYTKGDYKWIESYVNKFEPGIRCPCGKDDLSEMILAYFQWVHPETQKMQLARYLISKEHLGRGGVGVVYHGTMISYPENKPHVCVAIKMATDGTNIDVNISTDIIQREINVMESFRKTNHIIGYGPRHYNIRFEERAPELAIAIVMQIGQSFQNYWSKEMKDYSEELMLKVLKQILIGIDEIHQKDFIHLDLKIDNIVKMPSINDNDEIYLKIIDFGGAIEVVNADNVTSFNMKPEFAAPEIIVPKFFEKDTKIVSCLKWEPEERPNAEELLKLEHFKDISTPTENGDFFGEMTKYLDEQFQKISKYLKSKKFAKHLLHPLVRLKNRISKFKLLNRKKHINKNNDVVKNTNEFNEKEQQSQNQHPYQTDDIRSLHFSSQPRLFKFSSFPGAKPQFRIKKGKQNEKLEDQRGKHQEGKSPKHGIIEKTYSADSDNILPINSPHSSSFHSAKSSPGWFTRNEFKRRHSFEHLKENSPHSTPFHTAPSSPERKNHSSSSTNESEIQLASEESVKLSDSTTNILPSTELSSVHSDKIKKEIASKKNSCCDHPVVKFLKKAAKFCGNCLLGPANYDDELKKKEKKEVQKN